MQDVAGELSLPSGTVGQHGFAVAGEELVIYQPVTMSCERVW
jgi:hypothetical protein